MQVVLDVVEGPDLGRQFSLEPGDLFLVGRSARCHLTIENDMKASRVHLILAAAATGCTLRDLSSRNGTFVNETRVAEADLKHGDLIRSGRTVFSVSMQGAAVSSQNSFAPPIPGPFTTHPAPDEHLGRYKLLYKMREGGMGVVWLAEDTVSGEQVALKTILPAVAPSREIREIFQRECRISRSVRHPNIVRFIDGGEHEGCLYLVLEYIAGQDAATLRNSKSEKRLGCTDVVEIGMQALNGLETMHGQNLVHRDIKPSNLMVTGGAGNGFQVKIIDFGVTRSYQGDQFSTLTHTGEIRGTPPYMPPEQVLDCRRVDRRADIFSLGATLYNLLTGAFVYPFQQEEHPLVTIVDADIVPLDQRGAAVPRALADVIHRAVQKDPRARYQCAAEMQADLARAQHTI